MERTIRIGWPCVCRGRVNAARARMSKFQGRIHAAPTKDANPLSPSGIDREELVKKTETIR